MVDDKLNDMRSLEEKYCSWGSVGALDTAQFNWPG
jgi:hypothetical protein